MTLFEITRRADEALKRSGLKAIDQARRAGVPAYYSDAIGIIREMPDGSRQRIRLTADGEEVVLAHLLPDVPEGAGAKSRCTVWPCRQRKLKDGTPEDIRGRPG